MAENRNITWNIQLVVDPKVVRPFKLQLISSELNWGKYGIAPPAELVVPGGSGSTNFRFKAMGAACTATGTQGRVVYASNEPIAEPTHFIFEWDIPYSSANSGFVRKMGNSANYLLNDGGGVPASGNSITVDVTITQDGPVDQ